MESWRREKSIFARTYTVHATVAQMLARLCISLNKQKEQPWMWAFLLCVAANSLELLVLSGAANLGGESLRQFVQAAGVFQFNLRFAAEELLQVLQQLDTRLRLLLQAFELLHQLVTDLCRSKQTKMARVSCFYCCHNSAQDVLSQILIITLQHCIIRWNKTLLLALLSVISLPLAYIMLFCIIALIIYT